MIRALAVLCLTILLAACTGTAGLAPSLTDRMDQPGARLDQATAVNLINQYRATKGHAPLRLDAGLNADAQILAAQYAATGKTPARPQGDTIILTSAGYATLADTFSGWRGGQKDADTMADVTKGRAGLGVVYAPSSTYGVYWVMLLAPPLATGQ